MGVAFKFVLGRIVDLVIHEVMVARDHYFVLMGEFVKKLFEPPTLASKGILSEIASVDEEVSEREVFGRDEVVQVVGVGEGEESDLINHMNQNQSCKLKLQQVWPTFEKEVQARLHDKPGLFLYLKRLLAEKLYFELKHKKLVVKTEEILERHQKLKSEYDLVSLRAVHLQQQVSLRLEQIQKLKCLNQQLVKDSEQARTHLNTIIFMMKSANLTNSTLKYSKIVQNFVGLDSHQLLVEVVTQILKFKPAFSILTEMLISTSGKPVLDRIKELSDKVSVIRKFKSWGVQVSIHSETANSNEHINMFIKRQIEMQESTLLKFAEDHNMRLVAQSSLYQGSLNYDQICQEMGKASSLLSQVLNLVQMQLDLLQVTKQNASKLNWQVRELSLKNVALEETVSQLRSKEHSQNTRSMAQDIFREKQDSNPLRIQNQKLSYQIFLNQRKEAQLLKDMHSLHLTLQENTKDSHSLQLALKAQQLEKLKLQDILNQQSRILKQIRHRHKLLEDELSRQDQKEYVSLLLRQMRFDLREYE